MAKAKDVHDPNSVSELIQKLEPDFAELVQAIRKHILSTDKIIGEQIKWNSPSFFYTGEMKLFDPKEYKRDIVVLNLRKGIVLLVFPTGATVNDTSGILEGNYTDGRRIITIKNKADLKAKSADMQKIIRIWLKQVESK